ncbi:hypothetical protein [Tateyamaria sp. syn59]|uniref:hypothetical protein n=1 Tax=Tateyamaria sp. syn59 TaxID=2576942 RepID=UPI00167647E1|nr:hypothetical protein [Tateyamaria sp. syn59]
MYAERPFHTTPTKHSATHSTAKLGTADAMDLKSKYTCSDQDHLRYRTGNNSKKHVCTAQPVSQDKRSLRPDYEEKRQRGYENREGMTPSLNPQASPMRPSHINSAPQARTSYTFFAQQPCANVQSIL